MEEDIKILEERVTTLKRHIKNYEESDCKTNVYQQLVKECKALENLLTRYKQLEENNKQLEKWLNYYNLGDTPEEFEELFGNVPINDIEKIKKFIFQRYIPKSKVKEKIKELEREFDFYAGREHFEWQDGEFDGDVCDDIALKIGALKELLREE